MRYHCFITDYDGTLASENRVVPEAIQALEALKATGRKLILVTGRQLEELKTIFPEYGLFDRIVAENGAVLYCPATQELSLLGLPPPKSFIADLESQSVPIAVGHVIVAGWEPHQQTFLNAIRSAGLEYQLIFNKGAIMVLPPGINKATGLHHALRALQISEHNAVAIGDAENDTAMLLAAECAVAVQNALPQVGGIADWTTDRPAAEGVIQLIQRLISDDLGQIDSCLSRHYLPLGKEMNGSLFQICPYGERILLAGTSGFGKTTLAAAFIEKLIAKAYQFCLIDPEGDYQELPGVLTIGDGSHPPLISEVTGLLARADENVIVCILAVPLDDRPAYFNKLAQAVAGVRKMTGHPHFMIMDEAHHLMPRQHHSGPVAFPDDFNSFLAITTRPELLDQALVQRINTVLVMGEAPDQTMRSVAHMLAADLPLPANLVFKKGEVLVWQKDRPKLRVVTSDMPGALLMRHKRKYATGDMDYNSFYFTGPGHRLNLKANNLMLFIQMASGIDDDTWYYHLHRHDYANWFRHTVKDEKLAQVAEKVERRGLDPWNSRKAIFKAILERYTLPA
ncbi:HAD-IIB family hydrolase [Mucilaginibacter aquariorum]|uniref:HAD-IIB family hydrolase n=1 Tax=Mucilaginibacter aquariorum TaxID=2967225 RepID=A0ABT1T285_9SPHI|nr:HAD-IIB family hydrolase [Mucilaginibacter aquariorum]MCQ6958726.1 HAD-IIB family hydrolase [Mucilaginibacter aquariorum]